MKNHILQTKLAEHGHLVWNNLFGLASSAFFSYSNDFNMPLFCCFVSFLVFLFFITYNYYLVTFVLLFYYTDLYCNFHSLGV